MRVVYVHHEPLTFTDYLNLDTGQTLSAVPGETYDIAPASGHVVPEVPEPWFTAAEPLAIEAGEPDLWSAGEPEQAPEPGTGAEPETPEG
jgi:hypothetical protein